MKFLPVDNRKVFLPSVIVYVYTINLLPSKYIYEAVYYFFALSTIELQSTDTIQLAIH